MSATIPSKSASPNGSLLVFLQFAGLTALALLARPALLWWPSATLLALSAVMMVASLVSMGKKTFRFHPEPADDGELRTGGVFRIVRHPMYSAALLASFTILWTHPVWPALAATAVVAVVLRAKIAVEEQALRQKFSTYSDYARRVPAVVPWFPGKDRNVLRSCIVLTILLPSLWLPIETHWDARLFPIPEHGSESPISVNLSTAEAKSLLETIPDLTVIDIRSEWEASGSRLSGALRSNRHPDELKIVTQHLSKDSPLLVYCAGGFRSRLAIAPLKKLGFREIYHLNRGIMAWKLAGLPTEGADHDSSTSAASRP